MKSKFLKILFVLSIVALVSGCGKKEAIKEDNQKQSITGGWELNTSISNQINMEKEEIFKKAVSNYTEMELETVGYLGSQVVAGTNHMYLCKATKNNDISFKIVVVYEDLNGNAEITGVRDFKVEEYLNVNIDGNNEEVTGGWTASSECGENSLSEDEREMFNKAIEKLTGVSYKPVGVLATQVVSGENYAVLAVGEIVTESPVYNIYILTIYKDLSGNSEVSSIAKLNLSIFS